MKRLAGRNKAKVIAYVFFICIPATCDALPNLMPYQPPDWSDKIVVSDVSGTTTDVRNLVPTDTLYLDWSLLNGGDGSVSASFTVELYVDDLFRAFWTVASPINVGGTLAIEDYNLGSLGLGAHTLRIKYDATNSIAEGNETDNEYTKTITVYDQKTYTITTSVSPTNAGTIFSGRSLDPDTLRPADGTFAAGSFHVLTVMNHAGFNFANWSETGNVLSTSPRYSFILDRDRNIVANFNVAPPPIPIPTITVSASPKVVNEGQSGVFTISASTVNPSFPVTVYYHMSGKALYGDDYVLSGSFGQVTIPAGASSATVTLTALADTSREKNQKAIMVLQPAFSYNLPRNRKVSLTIANVLPAPPAP